MTDKQCPACGYVGGMGRVWATSSDGHGNLIASLPGAGHIGAVTLELCPGCGAVWVDLKLKVRGSKRCPAY